MTDQQDLAKLLAHHTERAAVLLAAYEAASPRDRRSVLLVEYRCRVRRCELLVCWQAAGTRLVRLPPYKLSHPLNDETSVEGARAKRTTDGDRHWTPRVLVVDEMGSWGGSVSLDLNCDHFRGNVTVSDVLTDAGAATPGAPKRRAWPLLS